jgi:hypothetical protein
MVSTGSARSQARHLHAVPSGVVAEDAAANALACAADEVTGWVEGDGLTDGLLAVRRADEGFVVYDGEAAEPQLRRATLEEALEFVVAIRSTVGPRPRLALAS